MAVPARRAYATAELVADAIVHALGGVLGIVACVALAILAWPPMDLARMGSLAIYALGLGAMLACSALYHLTTDLARKARFRRLDHAAIFLMIAGTYTPFALVEIGGPWGHGLLAFIWAMALAGVLCKLLLPLRLEALSVGAYLVMGWAVLVALEPLRAALSAPGIMLLAIGGAFYTGGVVFHLWTRLPYHQAIWHGCVLAAAGCHYAAILREVALTA
jgi:hemolysin III